jgi:hypothetical protein
VNEVLSSDHNHPGDTFTATLAQPVVAQGIVVARRGETLAGRVAEAQKAGRVKGTSQLSIEVGELTLVDGQHVPLRTELISYSGPTSVGADAAVIGTSTGIGAAIGAAADGGFGAGMGAIAGAGASIIGVLATRGQPTIISPEGTVTFKTSAPMTISTESAPQAFHQVQQYDYEPQQNLQGRPPAYAAGPRPPYYGGGPYYGGPGFYGPGYYGGGVVIYASPRYRGGYYRGRRW